MPSVEVNGHRMHYELHGDGDPAVAMGGWGTFCHGKISQVPRAVTDRFTTLIFDYRGIGESTDDPHIEPSMALYADDLAALCDHLGWEQVHVLGMVGMGACIGQELAIGRPDLVRSLAMTGTWAAPDPVFRDQIEGLRRAHLEAGFEVFQLLCASFSFTPEFYARARERIIGPDGAWSDLAGRADAHSRLVDACLAHDTLDRLHRIACPTLVIHAGRDVITRPDMTRMIEERIPDAVGVDWPEIGHVIAGKEQRIAFDRILTEFYDRVEDSRRTA